MKRIYTVSLLFFVLISARAQPVITIQGATTGAPTFYVKSGATVYIKGGITIDQNGSPAGAAGNYLQNNGLVTIASDSVTGQSDFTNNVNNLRIYTTGQSTGEVIFSATNETQAITGGGTVTFMNLTTASAFSPLLDMKDDVTVDGDMTVGGSTAWIDTSHLTINGNYFNTAGTLTGGDMSDLTINGNGNLASPLYILQFALRNFNLNRVSSGGHTVKLASALSVTDSLNIRNGILDIQDNPLTLASTGVLSGAPYSAGNMIQADSTGYFYRAIAAGVGMYIYPVGDGTPNYSPVTFDFASYSVPGGIGVRVKNAIHPEMNNPTAPASYLKRYWSFISSNSATYTYNATFGYVASDIVGTEADLRMSRWANPWYAHASAAAANVLNTTAIADDVLAPLSGDFTGRNNAACTAIAGAITATLDSICEGETTALAVNGNNGNLQWQSSATGAGFTDISGITGTSYSPQPSQTTYYRVYAEGTGCADTSQVLQVTVKPLPAPAILTMSDSLICYNDSSQVCASAGFSAYLWNTGATTACIYAKAAGGYWVTATGANGCANVSLHEQLAVYPVPSVSIIVNGDTLSTFGGVSYQWYRNGAIIPGATASLYVATQPGNYTVEVTDANGCKALSGSITGVDEEVVISNILVYPNPATSEVMIYRNDGAGLTEVRITNLLGQEVKSHVLINGGYQVVKIDVQDLPAGTYHLMLYNNEQYLGSKRLVCAAK